MEEAEGERVLLSQGRMHIDLIKRVVAVDAASGTETFMLEADPRRYDWEEVDGVDILVDKFEANSMPAENFFALVGQLIRQPLYREIKDITEAGVKRRSFRIYLTNRRPSNG
jgi:hypothetical protein